MSNSNNQKLKSLLRSRRLIVPLVAILLLINSQLIKPPLSASSIETTTVVSPDPTTAPLLSGNHQVVDDGPDDQREPHIDCNLVAYTNIETVNGSPHVKYFDFLTNTQAPVPTIPFESFGPYVDGTRIAYVNLTFPGSEIVLFDTSSGNVFTIPGVTTGWYPSIGGNLVAFPVGFGLEREIAVYNTASGTLTQLTNDSLRNLEPTVTPAGDAVVFHKCQTSGLGCDIYSAIQTSPGVFTTSQLTGPAGEETNVETDGSIVVYESLVNGDRDIAYQPIGGGTEVRIMLQGDQVNPSTTNNLITFESLMSPGNYDVFAYDITNSRLFRITETPVSEGLNDITFCGGQFRVVYDKVGVSNYEIHAFTFQLPDSEADEIEDLIDLVISLDLKDGTENSLITKLENVLDALDQNDTAGACDALAAFINEVQAQSGKKIPTTQADQLINSANQIKQALGCA